MSGFTLRTQANVDANEPGTHYATEADLPADYKDTTVEATLNLSVVPENFLYDTNKNLTLKKVFLGADVTKIDERAFYKCEELEEVHIAENSQLQQIKVSAFTTCYKLRALGTTQEIQDFTTPTLKIPDSVTYIEQQAFTFIGLDESFDNEDNFTVVLPPYQNYTQPY